MAERAAAPPAAGHGAERAGKGRRHPRSHTPPRLPGKALRFLTPCKRASVRPSTPSVISQEGSFLPSSSRFPSPPPARRSGLPSRAARTGPALSARSSARRGGWRRRRRRRPRRGSWAAPPAGRASAEKEKRERNKETTPPRTPHPSAGCGGADRQFPARAGLELGTLSPSPGGTHPALAPLRSQAAAFQALQPTPSLPAPAAALAQCPRSRRRSQWREAASVSIPAPPAHPPPPPSWVARSLVSQRRGDVRHSAVHIRRRLKPRRWDSGGIPVPAPPSPSRAGASWGRCAEGRQRVQHPTALA